MPASALHRPVLDWYAAHARDLPWREPGASAWAVLVSEVMLQQTPVARVLPVYESWLTRWPTPPALAAAPAGEAVRAWGRLGYPRRALRLHAAAGIVTSRYGGEVPDSLAELRALPGIGDYTAAAVASFAYRQRHAVLDTNVRRVLARTVAGSAQATPSITRAERRRAEDVLPDDPDEAATWGVAVMDLGALVCSASAPDCTGCPVATLCAWRAAGAPAYDGPARAVQTYAGTDRQCRGRLLDVLRHTEGPVHRSRLEAAWHLPEQRERCLASLLADGLVARAGPHSDALPG